MSGGIFISYRRDDSAGYAGRIYDRLTSKLDRERIFIDVDNIPLGSDFVKVLSDRVGDCDALIAIIGRNWMNAVKDSGERRLDDPRDFVRIEIEAALARDIQVIPVFVDGVKELRPEQLPDGLKLLAQRHGLQISHERFDYDAERLTKALGFVEEARKKRDAEAAARLLREEQERAEAERQAEIERAAVADVARRAEEQRAKEAEEAARQAEDERKQREAEESARLARQEQERAEADLLAEIEAAATAEAARRAEEQRASVAAKEAEERAADAEWAKKQPNEEKRLPHEAEAAARLKPDETRKAATVGAARVSQRALDDGASKAGFDSENRPLVIGMTDKRRGALMIGGGFFVGLAMVCGLYFAVGVRKENAGELGSSADSTKINVLLDPNGIELSRNASGIATYKLIRSPTDNNSSRATGAEGGGQNNIEEVTPTGDPVVKMPSPIVYSAVARTNSAIWPGTVAWQLISSSGGDDATPNVFADVAFTDAKIRMTLTIFKNAISTRQAPINIGVAFGILPESKIKGVKQLAPVQMRQETETSGDQLALTKPPVRVGENEFSMELVGGDSEAHSIELLQNRQWMDIPLILADSQVVRISLEKGDVGDRLIRQAASQWAAQQSDFGSK